MTSVGRDRWAASLRSLYFRLDPLVLVPLPHLSVSPVTPLTASSLWSGAASVRRKYRGTNHMLVSSFCCLSVRLFLPYVSHIIRYGSVATRRASLSVSRVSCHPNPSTLTRLLPHSRSLRRDGMRGKGKETPHSLSIRPAPSRILPMEWEVDHGE